MTDPYTDTSRCVTRLLSEYEKHRRIIVALDFDDTVFDYHGKGFTYPRVTDLMKEASAMGFYIVPFTGSPPEKYPEIYAFFDALGINVSPINTNPFPLPFGNHGKMYFNILLDDRAGLGQALDTLETVIRHIKLSNTFI